MEHSGRGGFVEAVLDAVEYVALAIEVMAVSVIALGILSATLILIWHRLGHPNLPLDIKGYRARMGSTLLLGLEILVAADIVRTVALEPSLQNAAVLGLLVVIRTFLSWSLVIEIEERWPWQPRRSQTGGIAAGDSDLAP
jgi:uncharacterized membrane protein